MAKALGNVSAACRHRRKRPLDTIDDYLADMRENLSPEKANSTAIVYLFKSLKAVEHGKGGK